MLLPYSSTWSLAGLTAGAGQGWRPLYPRLKVLRSHISPHLDSCRAGAPPPVLEVAPLRPRLSLPNATEKGLKLGFGLPGLPGVY